MKRITLLIFLKVWMQVSFSVLRHDYAERRTAQHGHEFTRIEVDEEGLWLLSRHLKGGQCPATKLPLNPHDDIPVCFTLENNDTIAIVICGKCKKELGKCKVAKCSNQVGNFGTAQN